MPVLSCSNYKHRPLLFFSKHIETIYPSAFRKVTPVSYERERLELSDGDFLDVDWLKNDSKRVVILSHGLEGNSHRPYIQGAARLFEDKQWDVLAWNYRSCSAEMNRNKRLYHHGVTDDFEAIVKHALSKGYSKIGLVGFSMGGSTTLKYLGEQSGNVPGEVIGAAVFSVPCNLYNSMEQLMKWGNGFYRRRFLKKLIKKIQRKAEQFPEIDITDVERIDTFLELDNRFTAPLHGFKDGLDFYEKSTSDQFYPYIKRPALIVNAVNDPMLGDKCYPYDYARNNEHILLETPKWGGHVGFMIRGNYHTYSEIRALDFLETISN